MCESALFQSDQTGEWQDVSPPSTSAGTQVEILNPILRKETEDDKLAILDIVAKDERGRLLNVEMQTSLPAGMSQRPAYYVSNLYVSQLYEGNQYRELRPAESGARHLALLHCPTAIL